MDQPEPTVRVTDISPISPKNEAVYEVGKKMLEDSLEIGREFAKFMITLSIGAIPVYVGLLELLGVQDPPLVTNLLAPACFLLAAVLFIAGYFPRHGQYSLNVVDDIEAAIRRAITTRTRLIYGGVIVFMVGIIIAVAVPALLAPTAAGPAPGLVVETTLIPANAPAAEVQTHLAGLQTRLNQYTIHGEVTYREITTPEGTLIVTLFQATPR